MLFMNVGHATVTDLQTTHLRQTTQVKEFKLCSEKAKLSMPKQVSE